MLTEKDTEALDGGLKGRSWTLALNDPWVVVKPESQKRLKPSVEAWAVDPAGPVQLTVECSDSREPVETSLRAAAQATAGARQLREVEVAPLLGGPWLEAARARWVAPEGLHVLARFRLLAGHCDVHGWGPREGGDALRARLDAAVGRFQGQRPLLIAELVGLTAFLKANEAAQQRLSSAEDAGYGSLLGLVLMEDALARLPPALLVERFQLRLALLEVLPPGECGELVRHQADPSAALLERMPEPMAVRWIELTREAIGRGLTADAGFSYPKKREVQAAIERLVKGDGEVVSAIELLRGGDRAPNEAVCAAEKIRLARILRSPPADRRLLLLSLLGQGD